MTTLKIFGIDEREDALANQCLGMLVEKDGDNIFINLANDEDDKACITLKKEDVLYLVSFLNAYLEMSNNTKAEFVMRGSDVVATLKRSDRSLNRIT